MLKIFTFLLLSFQALGFSQYYSQCGKDKFINEAFFKNMRNGFFLDVGAHDGVSFSNTCFFEKELGWTGVCIEPIADVFANLRRNRNCYCLCGCAVPDDTLWKDFLRISGTAEMLSGLVDAFDPRHVHRISAAIRDYGGACEVIKVPCYNLNQVLESVNATHINLLSMDTEGGEFKLLQSIDFSKFEIDVITVEDNYGVDEFIPFLISKGFNFVGYLHQDLLFINANFIPN